MPQHAKPTRDHLNQQTLTLSKHTKETPLRMTFEQQYPAIAEWIEVYGWVELGQDNSSLSMVRAVDSGGVVWEGKSKYASLEALLRDLDKGLAKWLEKNA